MHRQPPQLAALLLIALAWPASLVAAPPALQRYQAMCDASTAIAVGADRFLVSNDEKNVLWLYRVGQPEPLEEIDIAKHLDLKDSEEADIEGSARIGETVYWITSHGRNKKGELHANRFRFFALTPREAEGKVVLEPSGKPYTHLMEDLLEAKPGGIQFNPLTTPAAPAWAPEAQGGTNIEGLAVWKESQLLIAFRNPVPDGKALLVPLENPAETLEGKKARFGQPIQLDLGGLGIRSLEYWPERNTYLVVAGAFDDCPAFQLFLWSGDPASPPKRQQVGDDLFGLRPEALVLFPGQADKVLLLSDDGGVAVEGKECKKASKEQRSFQAIWLSTGLRAD